MPFFKRSIVLGLSFVLSPLCIAEQGIVGTIDAAIERSKDAGWLEGIKLPDEIDAANPTKEQAIAQEIAQNARKQLITGSKNHLSGWIDGADQFANAINEPSNGPKQMKDIPTDYPGMKIYISFGMPESQIKEALEISSSKRIPIQVKGLLKGTKNMLHTFQYVARLTNELKLDPAPLFQLNPNNFNDNQINGVPAMTYETNGKIYKVTGLMNPDWFLEHIDTHSDELDLGVFGDVHEVEELDFVVDMQQRMQAINWKQKQENAYANFWKKQDFAKLPAATEDKRWYIDPTVKIQKDILNRRGELIGMEGEIINPLSKATSRIHLVVFNPKNPLELTWVDDLLTKQDSYSKIMLLATELDKDDGWKQLATLRARFKRNVFLNQPEIIRKFALKGTPSQVEATGQYLTVTQHHLAASKPDNNQQGQE